MPPGAVIDAGRLRLFHAIEVPLRFVMPYGSRESSMLPGRYLVKTPAVIADHPLRNSVLSLAQIAQHLGYSDATAFSRGYRLTGLTPSGVRNQAPACVPCRVSDGDVAASFTPRQRRSSMLG
jgi:AraC-like DNA-binding protein